MVYLSGKRSRPRSHSNPKPLNKNNSTLTLELGIVPTQKTKGFGRADEGKGQQSAETSALTQKRPRTVVETSPSKISICQAGLAWKKLSKFAAHARYHIFAYGYSRTIYKEVEKAKFAKLLGIYDVYDHTRQDNKSVAAIRSMKPVWKPGTRCFRWIST
jgi:hypothetical protein